MKSDELERILVRIIVEDFNPHDNPKTIILTENALESLASIRLFEMIASLDILTKILIKIHNQST